MSQLPEQFFLIAATRQLPVAVHGDYWCVS